MTVGDLHDLLVDFSRRGAALLASTQVWGPDSPAHQKLIDLVTTVHEVFLHLCVLIPEVCERVW